MSEKVAYTVPECMQGVRGLSFSQSLSFQASTRAGCRDVLCLWRSQHQCAFGSAPGEGFLVREPLNYDSRRFLGMGLDIRMKLKQAPISLFDTLQQQDPLRPADFVLPGPTSK